MNNINESEELSSEFHDIPDTLDKEVSPYKGGKTSSSRENVDLLSNYFSSIRRYPLLSSEEESEIGRKARDGDRRSIDLMITSNLRLVVKIAKNYRARGVPLLDL
ncbi:MAG: sigma-70 factor domain-containing protein, partial [Succinivibrio dextrinosolvens]|nr:sigma-70 factor domain-containing protein [Succinivibrio dextrinosolvens]